MQPGEHHHRLTAIGLASKNKWGQAVWLFRCDCGAERRAIPGDVRTGRVRSCGCLHKETVRRLATKHGLKHSPGYNCWQAMLNRCRNKNLPHWASYGGRGIKVCERWYNFECFLEDMGPRPSLAHSLDRANNDGNYEPGNVRWAVDAQQRRNKRNNVAIEIDGRRLVVADAAKLVGVPAPTIYDRLRRGLSPEESIR